MANVTLKTLEAIEKMGMEGMLVTQGFYKTIFDLVLKQNELKNGDDWKGSISSVLHQSALSVDPEVIRHAVIHFTGNADCSVVTFQTYYIKVTTKGYRAGPCGDH